MSHDTKLLSLASMLVDFPQKDHQKITAFLTREDIFPTWDDAQTALACWYEECDRTSSRQPTVQQPKKKKKYNPFIN
jgi:hypothetical protein